MATLSEAAYQRLKADIWSGRLVAGHKITERAMADHLETSPTPVREAIGRLVSEGLVERVGPRTHRVADVSGDAVRDIAEVEVALRGLVARFAAKHATDDQLAGLDAVLDEIDEIVVLLRHGAEQGRSVETYLSRLLDALDRFNSGINACAHNPVLVSLLEQTQSIHPAERRARTAARIMRDDGFGLERHHGHRQIVAALREQDGAEAEQLTITHALAALDDLVERNRSKP